MQMVMGKSVRRPPGQSIKTRVEAPRYSPRRRPTPVRLDNPLKQGLKLQPEVQLVLVLDRPPGQSIKTRVEASPCAMPRPSPSRPPGQSIKTRVEA